MEKKYVLVSNRGPDIIIGGKEHKAKGGTKNAYKFLFDNFCNLWFFILPKDFYSEKKLEKFCPIFIDNNKYNGYYYKYISEYLYLYLLGENNEYINYLDYLKDFNFVNEKILYEISHFDNIILCDYHLYNLPKNLFGKNLIYFWFIPFLDVEKYKEKETIKSIVYSLSFCKKIIFLNNVYLENFKKLHEYFFGKEKLKTELVVNLLGADEFFVDNDSYFKNENTIKLGMISRLDPIKNILKVIEAYELFLKIGNYNIEFEILAEYHR